MIAVGPEPPPFQDETMPPATFIEPTASSQQTNIGRGPDAVDGSMIDPFGRQIAPHCCGIMLVKQAALQKPVAAI